MASVHKMASAGATACILQFLSCQRKVFVGLVTALDRKILKDTVTKAAFVPNLKTLVGVVTWFK